jgi:adenylate cyclase
MVALVPTVPDSTTEVSIARAEVEQTLRLAQDEAERDIAFFRLVFFAVIAVVSLGIHFSRWGNNLFFPVFLWSVTVVNAALFLAVRRWGALLWVRLLSVFLDILGPTTLFFVGLSDDLSQGESPLYGIINFTAAMFALQAISSLRSSQQASLVGTFGATVAYGVVASLTFGLHPLLIFAILLLIFSGIASASLARRVRRNLERFARLQLLKRYLPSIAVDQVLDEQMDQALSVGGQQVTVTLMSTDLRGFTAMSDALQPAQVVEQLNAYHAMMLEEVRRHGGILDKFIGDGMLAVFGLSRTERTLTSAPDAGAQAAVSCTRDMLQALERLNATRAGQGLLPLRIGVGLHTGPVIAGNIGVPGHRIEFTVIGDAVNTAARLEGLTKEAGTPVLISGETVRRMSEPSGLVPRPAVTLRGKAQPLELFMLGELPPPA